MIGLVELHVLIQAIVKCWRVLKETESIQATHFFLMEMVDNHVCCSFLYDIAIVSGLCLLIFTCTCMFGSKILLMFHLNKCAVNIINDTKMGHTCLHVYYTYKSTC